MSEKAWYYLDHTGAQRGPCSREELLDAAGDQDLSVMRQGWKDYVPLSTMAVFGSTMDGRDLTDEAIRSGTYNRGQVLARSYDELLGLCKGVLADGVLNDAECVALHQWVDQNPRLSREWPISLLVDRLKEIFDDGIVDEEERGELKLFLERFSGERQEPAPQRANQMCFDEPPPTLRFDGRIFCFTGTFRFGTRTRCQTAVEALGGLAKKGYSSDVDYLVVGVYATAAWLHSNYGTKIRDAVEARAAGRKVRIVSEDHWQSALSV